MCPDAREDAPPAPLTRHTVEGLAVLRRQPAADAPLVVLVHGAMDRAASFGRTMRRLGDLDVVAYDRRGYDRSLDAGVAGGLSGGLSDHAADLAAVLAWAGAHDRSATVVGHSLGGTIALVLAGADPAAVVGLGLFECPVPGRPGYRSDGADLALAAASEGGPPAAAEAFYRLMVGAATWDRLRDGDRELRRSEGAALVAELRDLARAGAVPDPGGVLLPALVGTGDADGGYWAEAAVDLVGALPSAELVVLPGAGHGAHLGRPDEFARYVRRCVRGG
ncbi:MAG: alpha/beta fold hydrolase [Microthrixaceae bacterium]